LSENEKLSRLTRESEAMPVAAWRLRFRVCENGIHAVRPGLVEDMIAATRADRLPLFLPGRYIIVLVTVRHVLVERLSGIYCEVY
jgi:hypothetical protein